MHLQAITYPVTLIHDLIVSTLGMTDKESELIDMDNVIGLLSALERIRYSEDTKTFTWIRSPLNPEEIIDIFAQANQGDFQ